MPPWKAHAKTRAGSSTSALPRITERRLRIREREIVFVLGRYLNIDGRLAVMFRRRQRRAPPAPRFLCIDGHLVFTFGRRSALGSVSVPTAAAPSSLKFERRHRADADDTGCRTSSAHEIKTSRPPDSDASPLRLDADGVSVRVYRGSKVHLQLI